VEPDKLVGSKVAGSFAERQACPGRLRRRAQYIDIVPVRYDCADGMKKAAEAAIFMQS